MGREKELVIEKTGEPKRVVVIGGGIDGMAAAKAFTLRGHQVTMIEMMDGIGAGMVPNNQVSMMDRLAALGVRMLSSTKLLSVDGGDVTVECRGQKMPLQGFTNIVFACGSRSKNSICEELKEVCPTICIGDASSPRQALEAVREAVEAAVVN